MKRKDNRCKGCIYQAKRSAPYKCDYTEITGRCRIVNGKVQSRRNVPSTGPKMAKNHPGKRCGLCCDLRRGVRNRL